MKHRYFISRHQSTELSEVIEFVIDQNNKHHKKNQEKEVPIEEVNLLVKEEASISDEDSRIYVARNQNGRIIGSIRTCRWNRKGQLPMQKLFGIDPQEDVLVFNTRESNDYSVYLPVRNASQAVTLNHNGEVRIAGQIRKIHDITLEDINSFGEDIMTFSEGNVNIENGINTVHVLANHRKFNASYLITEMRFSARKRFLGGWISYKTEFFIQAPNGPEQSLGEHKSPFICQLPLNDGTKIYLWSRGVGSENKALMTISK